MARRSGAAPLVLLVLGSLGLACEDRPAASEPVPPPGSIDVCVSVREGEALSAACADGGYNLELGGRRDPTAPRPLQSGIRALCLPSPEPERDCPDLR